MAPLQDLASAFLLSKLTYLLSRLQAGAVLGILRAESRGINPNFF